MENPQTKPSSGIFKRLCLFLPGIYHPHLLFSDQQQHHAWHFFPPKQFAVNEPLFPFQLTQWRQNNSMVSTFPERPFATLSSNSLYSSINWQLTTNQMTKKHIRSCSQGSFLEEAAVTVWTNLAAVTLCHPQEGFVSLVSRTTRGAPWPLLSFMAKGQVFGREMPICPLLRLTPQPRGSVEQAWVGQFSSRAPHLQHRPEHTLATMLRKACRKQGCETNPKIKFVFNSQVPCIKASSH